MSITGIGPTTPPSQNELGRARLADTFDNFLLLLTTQLQNQDPLSPMDSNEFTSQLVAFAEVEQSLHTNAMLQELIDIQKVGRAASAVGFLGTTVETGGNRFALVDGRAEFTYQLQGRANATTISITDDAGRLVFTGVGETSAGAHHFVWDGRDNQGHFQGDGVYRVSVSAKDSRNEPVPAPTSIFGTVTAVHQKGGDVVLFIGDMAVPMDEIKSIRANTGTADGTSET